MRSITARSSINAPVRISREHRRHRSGSVSQTFLVSSRHFAEGDAARPVLRNIDHLDGVAGGGLGRRDAFSFALARKLLAHYETIPMHLDMRSVLDRTAESLA